MTNALAYFAVASETKNNKELSNALAYFESIIDEEKTSYNGLGPMLYSFLYP